MIASILAAAPVDTNEIPALPPGVKMTVLDNGLTIIVREDRSAPVVSAQAWCKTGSVDEGKWLGAGMSHVLEHMLFKGTTSREAGKIDREVQDAGGYMNAYTSFDRTVYYINVPNTGAKIAVDILCDIMQNATLPADEMVKEKQVILREMDMNTDDPGRRSSRRLFETAYSVSPYRLTVIGYPDIYNELKREDIFAYYRERYVPNNLFFLVVGDIKSDEVVAQIKEAFAKNKAKALAAMVIPDEPKQTATRETIEEAPIELGHFHLCWHIPEVRHVDTPALDVLATLLGSGRSSRLFQEIREKKGLVNSVDAWTYSPGGTGLFGVSAMVDPDKFEAAKAAILAELEKVKHDSIPAGELAKVVKQFIAGTLASRKTMQGQAADLGGSWFMANDLNFSERYLAAVKRVTAADLKRVANEYLTVDNRTLFALLPNGTAPKAKVEAEQISANPIQKFELPNGLKLLIKEDHRLPFVEFRTVFRGGVLAENPGNNGLTQLTSKMLLQGTAKRTAEQIAEEIESVGGSIDTFGGNNSFGVNEEVLSSDFETGMNLLADVLFNPTFPNAALERERQIQLAGIKSQKDQLLQSASRAMRRTLFGTAGYGLDALGSEESVQKIQVNDLKAFHQKLVAPNNCVLAIFGDVKTADVRTAVQKVFGDWKKAAAPSEPPTPSKPLAESKRVAETRDRKQAVLIIGYRGVTMFDQDRYALELLQEACSDLGSRLFVRIRENLGLAYYVGAQQFPGLVPGYFAFYVGTTPENVVRVEEELFKEAELLRKEGLSEEELKRAKAKVIGQKKIAKQDLGGLASTTALDELYGLGFNNNDTEDAKFESVTLEQVKQVAQKYLKPDGFVVSVIKPETK